MNYKKCDTKKKEEIMANNALKMLQLATSRVLTEHSYGNNWSTAYFKEDPGETPATMTYLIESLSEIVRKKSVEQWIDAGAGVGHCMGHNL